MELGIHGQPGTRAHVLIQYVFLEVLHTVSVQCDVGAILLSGPSQPDAEETRKCIRMGGDTYKLGVEGVTPRVPRQNTGIAYSSI